MQLNINIISAQELTYRGLGVTRDNYTTELLQAILEELPNKKLSIKRYEFEIPHYRSFQLLNAGKDIDIVIGYATQERIEAYQAIQLPIMKGLNGWRISFIHKDNINAFESVDTIEKLKDYSPGLFHTWTDNKIFSASNMNIVTGSDFNGLFGMLIKKRFDYFPLSILEVLVTKEDYLTKHKSELIIEPHIIITYPICFYFYVKKTNTELAQQLTEGFEAIIANGKYDAIFNKHHGETLNKFRSEKRTFINLENPLLPISVPLLRKELWLQPGSFHK